MTNKNISIETFNGGQALANEIAALHLAVRLGQRQDGDNDFITTNLYDSQDDLKHMQTYYVDPGGNFFIARDTSNDQIVGFIGLKKASGNDGEIKRMAVIPAYRRHGIGTRLVKAVIDWTKEKGFSKLLLYTGEDEKAMGIYKTAGFKLKDHRPERHDYLMTLNLT